MPWACVYIYICMYVYIYIYVCMYVYIYIYILAYPDPKGGRTYSCWDLPLTLTFPGVDCVSDLDLQDSEQTMPGRVGLQTMPYAIYVGGSSQSEDPD